MFSDLGNRLFFIVSLCFAPSGVTCNLYSVKLVKQRNLKEQASWPFFYSQYGSVLWWYLRPLAPLVYLRDLPLNPQIGRLNPNSKRSQSTRKNRLCSGTFGFRCRSVWGLCKRTGTTRWWSLVLLFQRTWFCQLLVIFGNLWPYWKAFWRLFFDFF